MKLNNNQKIKKADIALVIILSFAISLLLWFSPRDNFLKVYFLDVGQGDAIFIQAPNGNQILVDGGPDKSILYRLGQIMPFYDRSIDLVILTHPHADHLNGLINILERYKVDYILESKADTKTPEFVAWQEAVLKEGANHLFAKAGQVIELGPDLRLVIMHPLNDKINNVKNPNSLSVVAKLVYGNQSLLLTGDMERKEEQKLVFAGADVDSDFLKIAHHGSRTSTTKEFLDKVTPQLAFISVGAKNRYGHPTDEVLDRLENHGIKYYRTDIDGTIKLLLDGENYKLIFPTLD